MSHKEAARKNYTALIIDDDFTVRLLVEECLNACGIEVFTAENGVKGLALFEAHAPDIILLDVMMPGLSGYEVCTAIRTLPQGAHIPILMLTGLEDHDSINKAYDVGATDFAAKPINWTLLSHRVNYLLRSHHTMQRLAHSQFQLAKAQKLARLGSWEWRATDREIHLSEQAQELLEFHNGEKPTVRRVLSRLHPKDRIPFFRMLRGLFELGHPQTITHQLIMPSGQKLTVRSKIELQQGTGWQASTQLTGSIQDVTERQQAQRQILQLSNYDVLTGLPNRQFFQKNLLYTIHQAQEEQSRLAIFAIDLDNFKLVNDTMGHTAGDQMLQIIGQRLERHLRRDDLIISSATNQNERFCVSRMAGDEFTVVIPGLESPQAAARIAQRLLHVLSEPILLRHSEIGVSASIGIALFPEHGNDVEALTRKAGTALHHAKAKGRNAFHFYSEALNEAINQRLVIENELRQALSRGELELFYQPKLDIKTGSIIGAEALIRWRHPEKGLVSPIHFIPVAEDSGLIVPIGEWVIQAACKQASHWHRSGHSLQIAVNVSAKQFIKSNLVEVVQNALQASALPPKYLLLEITESTVMSDADQAIRTLEILRQTGVQVAIDDFGTGHSSLLKLKRLPVDELKIDRGFISDVSSASDNAAIVTAIIAMGRGLGQTIVAEGVETATQLSYLRNQGCTVAQGYLISKPIPAPAFTRLLGSWKLLSVA